MITEDKDLLLQILCAYLPYNIYVKTKRFDFPIELRYISLDKVPEVKPFLRSMSTMTKEEMEEYNNLWEADRQDIIPIGEKLKEEFSKKNYKSVWEHPVVPMYRHIIWLIQHRFDYIGLIPTGLALEALEGMYNI